MSFLFGIAMGLIASSKHPANDILHPTVAKQHGIVFQWDLIISLIITVAKIFFLWSISLSSYQSNYLLVCVIGLISLIACFNHKTCWRLLVAWEDFIPENDTARVKRVRAHLQTYSSANSNFLSWYACFCVKADFSSYSYGLQDKFMVNHISLDICSYWYNNIRAGHTFGSIGRMWITVVSG